MKYPNYTLIDTRDCATYEDYVEHCTDVEGRQPESETSEEFYSFVCDVRQNDWDRFMADMRCTSQAKQEVIITGTLGLWDGKKTIVPAKADNLGIAVRRCTDKADEVIAYLENGTLHIVAKHHDGDNCFTIRPLSALGRKKTEALARKGEWITEVPDTWVKKYKNCF